MICTRPAHTDGIEVQVWDQLGQLLGGIAALITAVAGVWVARGRQTAADQAIAQAQHAADQAHCRALRVTAMAHISYLELIMWRDRGWVPVRPDGLR